MSSGWENAPLPPGLPPGHVHDEGFRPPSTDLVPWESDGSGPLLDRFWLTFRDTFLDTSRFFEKVGNSERLGAALGYGTIFAAISVVAQQAWELVIGSSWGPLTALLTHGSLGGSSFTPAVGGLAVSGATIVGSVLLYPIGLLLSGAVTHLFLMMFGGEGRGLAVTVRVFAYGSAVHVLNLLPWGGYLASLIVLVFQIIGLSRAHRIPTGRAAAAVLLPVVFLCACLGAAFALLLGSIVAAFKTI